MLLKTVVIDLVGRETVYRIIADPNLNGEDDLITHAADISTELANIFGPVELAAFQTVLSGVSSNLATVLGKSTGMISA